MVQQYVLTTIHYQHKMKMSTKDESKKHAIFSSFTLLYTILFSTLISIACANPVPADDSSQTDDSTLKVSALPFSEKLRNPCALIDASRLQSSTLSQGDRESTKRTVIDEMKAKAVLLKDSAETVLKTNVLQGCTTLELPSVAVIPSVDELSNSKSVDVLRLFYTSLLNHTAHVYFISEQLQRYSADATCYSPDLSTSAKCLAAQMRELMCVLRLSTLTLQQPNDETDFFEDPTEQILNEQLTDQPMCSRRSVRDCQTVGSTVTLLSELSRYLQNTDLISDSDTSTES